MKLKSMASFTPILMTLTLMYALSACSKPQSRAEYTPSPSAAATFSESASEPSENESTSIYPIIITHAFGETVIQKKPERIATIAWANQDTPLALGILPVGFSMANFGPIDQYGMHSWTASKVAELGETSPNVFRDTDGIDYEAISDAQPDVILAAYSGLTQEEYDLLSKIAPVVAYPRNAWQTYWREQIITNAAGMGMKAEGEKYVADMEALIKETTAKYPQLKEKSGAFLWIDATDLSTFYLYFPVDTRGAYLTDLGIAFPEKLLELQTDASTFAAAISAENIDVLNDLDIIVAYGDHALLETLQSDPLFGRVPAIQRGSVVFIDSNTDLAGAATPSALSIPAIIDEYVSLLAKAADMVK